MASHIPTKSKVKVAPVHVLDRHKTHELELLHPAAITVITEALYMLGLHVESSPTRVGVDSLYDILRYIVEQDLCSESAKFLLSPQTLERIFSVIATDIIEILGPDARYDLPNHSTKLQLQVRLPTLKNPPAVSVMPSAVSPVVPRKEFEREKSTRPVGVAARALALTAAAVSKSSRPLSTEELLFIDDISHSPRRVRTRHKHNKVSHKKTLRRARSKSSLTRSKSMTNVGTSKDCGRGKNFATRRRRGWRHRRVTPSDTISGMLVAFPGAGILQSIFK